MVEKKEIFTELKKLLEKYGSKLKVTKNNDKAFELHTTKTVTLFNKEYPGLFFASVVIQGGFVGFYFFPIYTNPDKFKDMDPDLRKLLKGKSCFHIKKLDKELTDLIKDLLKQGYDLYKKGGII
ncbi:MAG TPA: DUF1801 domain-containing protein [Ignavibacteria bacterium]|nr:DUF1801 domain-containing protein [Ignavibacteria bacterium]